MKNAKGLTPEIKSNTDKEAIAWKYATTQRILAESGFKPLPIEHFETPSLAAVLGFVLLVGYVAFCFVITLALYLAELAK